MTVSGRTLFDDGLSEWLQTQFPNGFSDDVFDISKLLKGFEEHMGREMSDGRIPSKWTDTELQWDAICNALFDHHTATQTEQLAWMLVKLVSDRIHGQWRCIGNGGRRSELETWQRRQNWLFALRARLGVVDGWMRQNGEYAYSTHLFEALSNPVLLLLSPKTDWWDLPKDNDSTLQYQRLATSLGLSVDADWLLSVESVVGVSLLSDAGTEAIESWDAHFQNLSKKAQKMWATTDPVALQTIVQFVQRYAYKADVINRLWNGQV